MTASRPIPLLHPAPGSFKTLPAASAYHPVWEDLVQIQEYGDPNFKGRGLIEVRHRVCRGPVRFILDKDDPIMSCYRCEGGPDDDSCDKRWDLRDLKTWDEGRIQVMFYTVLIDEKAHEPWPDKLVEVVTQALRYSMVRPATLDEIYSNRNQRIAAVRAYVRGHVPGI